MPDLKSKTLTTIEPVGVQTRLNHEEEQALLQLLREGRTYSTGDQTKEFEREFSSFIGCADAVAVNSCSSALELAAILSGLKEGDEVILPAHTFVATAVPFARTGATLRWADIDPDTRLISPGAIQALVNERTKVVVAVHLYGLPTEMDAILALSRKHKFQVVEDCAQAPGARYKGRRVGSIGDFGCFSFHTAKNITTLGEGGMLAVRDDKHGVAARRLRWMGNWPFEGKRQRYWVPAMNNLVEPTPGEWPHNFCMGEPNAAVGRLLIKRLDQINEQRRQQAERFINALSDYPELSFQKVPAECEHVHHLMVARYDGQPYGKTRDDLIELAYEKYKLKLIVQYWPLNRSELFSKHGLGGANIPQSDRFFDNMVSFPWWSQMGHELVDQMAARVRSALDELRLV